MGCAASSTGAVSQREKESRRKSQSKERGYRTERRSDTPQVGEPSTPTKPSIDPTTLSQNLLTDLRQKTVKEMSSPVTRWIENIVQPSSSDNSDIYDPLRRHQLAMSSVANRTSDSRGSATTLTRSASNVTLQVASITKPSSLTSTPVKAVGGAEKSDGLNEWSPSNTAAYNTSVARDEDKAEGAPEAAGGDAEASAKVIDAANGADEGLAKAPSGTIELDQGENGDNTPAAVEPTPAGERGIADV